ncbi:MAG: N-acetylmuramoyl-L-alanine amidase [Gemmatimonadetes bacterium]|nr:N-acetylmuramoyl-L-alanine amidase [Gemmatimonadota bacterium]
MTSILKSAVTRRRSMTAFRSLLAAGILLPAVVGPARATSLLAIRHWSAPDHTRIVIDLSEPGAFTHRTLTDPDRIAVDVADGQFKMPIEPIPIDDGAVQRIRFNRLGSSGKVQVVLDLVHEARYDIFELEKYEHKPDRIVIDVKRPAASTPTIVPSTPRVEQPLDPGDVGDFLVMVDPGHGGEDAGRRNPDGLREKILALEFAQHLVEEINRKPGYRAELTRTGDYFVSLDRRRAIAEQRGAQLFVSIHFNAAPSRQANGTEVFFVSMKGSEDRETRELEKAENSADLVGGLPPRDQDTTDDLARMLVNLRRSDTVERSQQLAVHVTDSISRVDGIQTRKVKQAGFAVLKSMFIPAILVEVGFLTNDRDVRFVKSSKNRERYVAALADGIQRYCEEVEVPRLGWRIHTVGRGESLSEIAAQYAMNLSTLREVNQISGDRIVVGQKLRVRRR